MPPGSRQKPEWSDFAIAIVPGWHSTIFPPYFVAGAIYSGFAMVLTLAIPIRKFYRLEDLVTLRHLDIMGQVMLATGIVVAYGYMMGYHAEYAKYSPGAMIVCASIRYAIEQGFRQFDLSRGGESFKTSLATGVAYTEHATLTRPGVRVAAVNAGRRGFFAAKGFARQLLVRPA